MPRSQLHWFAILALPQREYVVALTLERRFGAETYVPTETKWRRKNRYCKAKVQVAFTAAPGYVLAGFRQTPPWLHVTTSPSVIGVINIDGNPIRLDERTAIMDPDGRPVRLTDEMLRRYMRAIPNGRLDIVGRKIEAVSNAPDEEQYMRTYREFRAGDEVEIVMGPLRDHRVEVVALAGKRATIKIELLGQTRLMDLPIWHLERAA